MLRSVTTLEAELDVATLRAQFPALAAGGSNRIFADAPGGTQVPATVIEAMSDYLAASNANTGGAFPTSAATEAVIDAARLAAADFLTLHLPLTSETTQPISSGARRRRSSSART